MNIPGIVLIHGSNPYGIHRTGRGCFLNICSYLAGDAEITDRPTCVHPFIRTVSIMINDTSGHSERQLLIPFILRAMESARMDSRFLMDAMREHLYQNLYELHRTRGTYCFSETWGLNADSPLEILQRFCNDFKLSEATMRQLGAEYLDKVLPNLTADYQIQPAVMERGVKLQELTTKPYQRAETLNVCDPTVFYSECMSQMYKDQIAWFDKTPKTVKKMPVFQPYQFLPELAYITKPAPVMAKSFKEKLHALIN